MGVWLRRRSPASPRPSFSHCPPGSQRGRGGPACGLGAQPLPPHPLFSRAQSSVGMVSVEGRVSHPFRNMEFCPNYSPSFTIPPPDIFQASHFTGVTRQQGLFLLLPLDFCEDPGRVSTLTGSSKTESWSPRGPSVASGWLCVIEQTLSPPGPQFRHLENEESGQDHLRGEPY